MAVALFLVLTGELVRRVVGRELELGRGAAGRVAMSAIQPSRPLPEATTSFAPAAALMSSGRGSYSCGSVLACRI